jgi:hypothetical protein
LRKHSIGGRTEELGDQVVCTTSGSDGLSDDEKHHHGEKSTISETDKCIFHRENVEGDHENEYQVHRQIGPEKLVGKKERGVEVRNFVSGQLHTEPCCHNPGIVGERG